MKLNSILALSALFICAIQVQAQTQENKQQGPVQGQANKGEYQPAKGWHFYDIPPEVVEMIEKRIEEEVEKRLDQQKPAKTSPPPGSSEWIKQNLPVMRQTAADNPTMENVRALLLVEKMLRDKSLRLARRAMQVAQSDPLLDSTYKPTSSLLAARERRAEVESNKQAVFQSLIASGVVFWLFVDETCSLCDAWYSVLQELTKSYGIQVLFVVPRGVKVPKIPASVKKKWEFIVESGQARKLGIEGGTALFAFNTRTTEYVHVSQGFVVGEKFLDRVIMAADFSGWITPDQAGSVVFDVNKNDLARFDAKEFSGNPDDPVAFANFIYGKLLEGTGQ